MYILCGVLVNYLDCNYVYCLAVYQLYTGDPVSEYDMSDNENDVAVVNVPNDMANVYAATVKLPDFWQHNPRPWFQHIEAQFQLRGINRDVTKYFHVVAALDASTTARAMMLLEAPPAAGKYEALKTFLLKLFELSELEKADRLLSLNGLGDSRPSEMMEKMLAVLGSADPSFLFTHIFLRQLPVPVRTALASSPLAASKDYRTLAAEADRVFLANRQQFVHALLPHQGTPPPPMEDYTDTAAAVTARRQPDDGLCYYHARFGAKAKQCRKPCSFKPQGNARAGAR